MSYQMVHRRKVKQWGGRGCHFKSWSGLGFEQKPKEVVYIFHFWFCSIEETSLSFFFHRKLSISFKFQICGQFHLVSFYIFSPVLLSFYHFTLSCVCFWCFSFIIFVHCIIQTLTKRISSRNRYYSTALLVSNLFFSAFFLISFHIFSCFSFLCFKYS